MTERFVGDREIAKFLSCSTRTVRRYRAAGRLPTRSIGRTRGCLESELLRALGVIPEFEASGESTELSADNHDNQNADTP